jgi:predicted methyltransferase
MSAGSVVKVECPANCYAKVVEAVSKTQFSATQEKLDTITTNQTTLISRVDQILTVMADLANLSKNLDEHKKDAEEKFNEVFGRLRKIENHMAWFMGGVGAIVGVLETLRLLHII